MSIVFGQDPIRAAVARILDILRAGDPLDHRVERQFIDLKEEHGRRDKSGALLPGHEQNESAAKGLLEAAACMANTPGGGALVVGVSNSGDLIGTKLDPSRRALRGGGCAHVACQENGGAEPRLVSRRVSYLGRRCSRSRDGRRARSAPCVW